MLADFAMQRRQKYKMRDKNNKRTLVKQSVKIIRRDKSYYLIGLNNDLFTWFEAACCIDKM